MSDTELKRQPMSDKPRLMGVWKLDKETREYIPLVPDERDRGLLEAGATSVIHLPIDDDNYLRAAGVEVVHSLDADVTLKEFLIDATATG